MIKEDQEFFQEWMNRLQKFGITNKDFKHSREKLSKEFRKQASIPDTI